MYKEMYYTLFNAVSDALDQMERRDYQLAMPTLELAQRKTEDLYAGGGQEQ